MVTQDDNRRWMRYTTVGMEFSVTFLAFMALGFFLDRWEDPSGPPAWMLTLGAIGFGIGLHRLIRQANEIRRLDHRGRGKDDSDRD
ncbi:MAG: AtpZ/AtpI family protein [Planctomycetes bacterium]|nr:AtpZ/AtpI family protein [Planctomycetota bacterium]